MGPASTVYFEEYDERQNTACKLIVLYVGSWVWTLNGLNKIEYGRKRTERLTAAGLTQPVIMERKGLYCRLKGVRCNSIIMIAHAVALD